MQGTAPTPPDRAILEATLSRLLGWIGAADAKVAPIIAINTGSLGALAAFAAPVKVWGGLLAGATVLTLILLGLSFMYAFFAAFPRTSGPKGSLVFFGGITELSEETFITSILTVTPEDYAKDLAKQCYRNAQIAGSKFYHVKVATALFLGALLPWATTIYLMYNARP